MKTARRAAKTIYIWLAEPVTLEACDNVLRQLDGWHASTYPSGPGRPLEASFFDHSKAAEAVALATDLPAVKNASPVCRLEIGRCYRLNGRTPIDDCVYRCVGRRGQFAEFVRLDSFDNEVSGTRFRKKVLCHDATNYLRGDYVKLDKVRQIFASDDAAE